MNKQKLDHPSDALCNALAAERGIDASIFTYLGARGLLTALQGCPAFPVLNAVGETIGAHVRRPAVNGDGHSWSYVRFGTDKTVTPLVVGNLETALIVWLFESQWDAIAALALHRWHSTPVFNNTIAAVITRGAQNGAKIRSLIPAGKRILAFPQNDPVKTPGKPTPAQKWLADIVEHAGAPVMVVKTPPQFKDLNDWMKAGASVTEFHAAVSAAQPASVTHTPSIELMGFDDQDDEPDDDAVPFPTDTLPPPYGDMVREASRVAQVPEALAAMVMLTAISTAVGQGLRAILLPGKITGANIYSLAVARSGIGKSSAAEPILAPLNDIQLFRLEQWQREMQPRLDSKKDILADEVKRLIQSAKKLAGAEQRQQLESALTEKKAALQEVEDALVAPRLICEDVTSQKLALLLQQNEETLALISTDAGEVVNNLLGRYNKLERSDDSLLVKAYTGEQCVVDRMGRGLVLLKHPCMTVLLMIQPDKLASLMQSRQLKEGGFLARCLIAQVDGELTHLEPGVREIAPAVRLNYTKHLTELTNAFRLGKQRHVIQATPEAQQILVDYANEVTDQREGGSPLRIDSFLARWAEQAGRLTVVLHGAKWGTAAATQAVDADTARAGVALARWFGRQQKLVLDAGEDDIRAQILTGVQNLAKQKPEGFTARDVYRARICDSADEAKRYLKVFVAKGLLLDTERQTGGRRTVVYQFDGGAS